LQIQAWQIEYLSLLYFTGLNVQALLTEMWRYRDGSELHKQALAK
jgi:hypothetical protein